MRASTTLVTIAFFLAAPRAVAAEPAARDAAAVEDGEQDADAAAYRGRQGVTAEYIYGDDHLDGDVLTPTGEIIPYRRPGKGPSLIRLRAHFMPELHRLGTDL